MGAVDYGPGFGLSFCEEAGNRFVSDFKTVKSMMFNNPDSHSPHPEGEKFASLPTTATYKTH
jgi:hypothetical protein